jgi:hypothetical protein
VRPEPEVEGRPRLALREEDREALAEVLAEMLLANLERERAEESA